MARTLSQKVAATKKGKLLLQQERAILEVTELICEIMEEAGVSRCELAKRLGKTRGYVTQLLDGRANMTIRTMADIFTVVGTTLHFQAAGHGALEDFSRQVTWQVMPGVPRESRQSDTEHGTLCPMAS